jgi:SAM-dependent methyltransferase
MNEKDWDAVAERFEEEIFNVPANDKRGLIKERVKQAAKEGSVAADLGCGTGRTVAMLADLFDVVYAADVSSECLDIARHTNRKFKNVNYLHADLAGEPVPIPQVDFVLCINTLLTADRERNVRMLDHVCRAVRPGGRLLLVVPSSESGLLTRYRLSQWDARDGVKHRPTPMRELVRADEGILTRDEVATKHFLKEELEDLLATRRFEVDEVLKIEYDWSTEFQDPPRWMKAPFPWDWLVSARKKRPDQFASRRPRSRSK